MANYTLPDGRVVSFDLERITRLEWRNFITGALTPKQDDEIVARVAGLELKDIESLSHPKYRRLVTALVKTAREPLEDPN